MGEGLSVWFLTNTQTYADDTQLNKSCAPEDLPHTVETVQNCIVDVKGWMTANKLKLNDSKTEVVLVKSRWCVNLDDSITSMRIGSTDIAFAESARDLGFMLSGDELSLHTHVANTCRLAYNEIRRIGGIRQYLTVEVTKTLVSAFVLSRLDFCNSLLSGCNKIYLYKLQLVQNSAARLIFRSKRRDHVTPLLHALHWLPVQARIEYKLCMLCFNFFSGTCPAYFSQLLTKYSIGREGNRSDNDSRVLTSIKKNINYVTLGERSFSFCAPEVWNSLPFNIRHKESMSSFKSALKTYLFRKYFS